MKLLRAFVLAATMSQIVAVNTTIAAPSGYSALETARAERAAQLLGTRTRDVIAQVNALTASGQTNANLQKAERLARQINIQALDLAKLIRSQADDSIILETLAETEDLVLQLDATKRALQRAYRYNFDIDDFNAVRTAYFELKLLLTGDI